MERHISQGKSPGGGKEGVDEVGPILSITSVLTAVFIPSAFWRACRVLEFYRRSSR